ncbi:structural protein [Pseudomonas purpurea]|uniref:structural protein n=1 Tax=Pseudomonas purpurea TaxID=3136737 RepID=UPI003264E622
MPITETRGVRNQNPGNIDYSPRNAWQGQLGLEVGVPKPRFARFDSAENGIRALGKLLLTYQRKHQLKTVAALIGRWAPTNENNTAAYVRAVEASTGTRPGAEVDLTTSAVMQGFVKAIIRHENAGYAYPEPVLLEGVRRALL